MKNVIKKGEAMYKYEDKIRYSDVDRAGIVPAYQVLNFFQNASTAQSEVVGKGVEYMMSHNRGWVLIGYKIKFNRHIRYDEDIIVGTEPTGFRGFFGRRNYCIMDPEQNYIVKADTLWTLIDIEKRMPVRITEDEFEGYPMGEPFDDVKASRKLFFKSEGVEQEPVKVLKSFIDNNGHMNNTNYLRVAYEYIPEMSEASEIEIAFVKEAVEGQEMIPYVHEEEDGKGVCFKDADGEVLANIIVRV